MNKLSLLSVILLFWFSPGFGQVEQAFLKPAKIIFNPANFYQYSPHSRKFTGIPSLAVSKGGLLWACWYAGMSSGEDANNYVVLASSNDDGLSWKEQLVIDPDETGTVRAFDPEIWIDPAGKLWLFWAQTVGLDGTVAGVWNMQLADANAADAKWTMPRRLHDGVMMCKPVVLKDGEWLLPVSTWRLTDNSAKVLSSVDKGKTWKLKGACDVPKEDREFDEHMIVELNSGQLWMLIRTRYGIGESFSADKGKTWSALKPSSIKHTSSRFFITKLHSGNLLLVKHGPIALKTKGRSHLMAFVSIDDGKSWSKGLLIDERLGVSYPDGQQFLSGDIHLVWDFNRTIDQQVLLTRFNEQDVLSADVEAMMRVFDGRKIISKKNN